MGKNSKNKAGGKRNRLKYGNLDFSKPLMFVKGKDLGDSLAPPEQKGSPVMNDSNEKFTDKILEDVEVLQRSEPKQDQKTYNDRLEQVEHVKKVRAVGYRLYKSEPNRPPTPDPSSKFLIDLELQIYILHQFFKFDSL